MTLLVYRQRQYVTPLNTINRDLQFNWNLRILSMVHKHYKFFKYRPKINDIKQISKTQIELLSMTEY